MTELTEKQTDVLCRVYDYLLTLAEENEIPADSLDSNAAGTKGDKGNVPHLLASEYTSNLSVLQHIDQYFGKIAENGQTGLVGLDPDFSGAEL
jgi:hypothetical protein